MPSPSKGGKKSLREMWKPAALSGNEHNHIRMVCEVGPVRRKVNIPGGGF